MKAGDLGEVLFAAPSFKTNISKRINRIFRHSSNSEMRLILNFLKTLQLYAGIPNAPPKDMEAASYLDVTAFTGPNIRQITI
jgi:hypothetical protein